MGIRVALFGQPRVLSEDGAIEYPLPRKTLNLLGYLILQRRRGPSRDSVAFALFPEEEEARARGSLRRNLSYLISSLPDGKALVDAGGERVAWIGNDAHVDVVAFEEAIAEGRDEEAIAEYAGDLLPTIYDEWTVLDRERLRAAFHDALARTIARRRSERNYDDAAAGARRLLAQDPWREDVLRLLMAVRYEAGDRAGALSAFEQFAERLRDEMRADPMAETIALRDTILRGERLATSDVPRRAGTVASEPALPFVGRNDAIETAREIWRAAADGRANVLFVSGEAGVGKTRFTTELARLAEREGALVVRGYTSAGGEHRPYEALVEALRGTPNLLDEHAGATLTDDRSSRLRLFESIRRRLAALSHARPLVVVLEDLHWAGPSTVDLLEYVAERLERSPVLFVVTQRSEEMAGAPALRALRRQLRGRGDSSEIVLGRLDARDAMRAARAALPESVDDDALARAVAWVDGVPLLLVEAVRDLLAGRTSTASDVAALVGERLERLTPNAQTALFFGASLGERFDLGTIEAATGWREDEALDAVGELIVAGLVRATARAPALAFAFTHDLIRVAATERIGEADRIRAHGLIARALAARSSGEAGAAAIARHFQAAGERERAAEQYARAARYALGVFANEDARESATAGLQLCADDPKQRARRYELLDLRERSLARLGAAAERRADAAALAELAEGDARPNALMRLFEASSTDARERARVLERLAALEHASDAAATAYAYSAARHAYLESRFADARALSFDAAERFERGGDHRAALRAKIFAGGALMRLGEYAEGLAELERLRPLLEAIDDASVRVDFHILSAAMASELDPERALEEGRRSLELTLRLGDRLNEARARQNLAVAASKLRLYGESLEQHELALAAYRDLGDDVQIHDELLNIAGVRLFCGETDGRMRELLDGVPSDGAAPWLAMRVHLLRGVWCGLSGDLAGAERHLLEARRLSVEIGAPYLGATADRYLAALRASAGRFEEARIDLQNGIAACTAMGEPDLAPELYGIAARLAATAGDALAARTNAERADALLRRLRIDSQAEVAWNIAAAYAAIGEDERAGTFAQMSAEAAVDDAMRMPPELAESYLRLPWNREAFAFLWERAAKEER